MVVHGADWLIPEQAQFYTWWDVKYMQMMLPLYVRKSSAVISVSQETTDNFNRILKLPADKIQTIYFAPAQAFRTESLTLRFCSKSERATSFPINLSSH